jgi:hypothetical protein
MKSIALALFAALSAASSAAAQEIAPKQIIGAAVGDWNKDGNPDLALLVAPVDEDDNIGIYIYLRDKDHLLLSLAASAPNKVAGNASLDSLVGQDPTLSALPNGSIAVHSENSGVGRDRWEQTLTIAYRNAAFVVAGFTYSHYDTLDPDHNGSCDYNVLSGKVSSSGKDSKVEARTVAVADWADAIGTKACGIKDE